MYTPNLNGGKIMETAEQTAPAPATAQVESVETVTETVISQPDGGEKQETSQIDNLVKKGEENPDYVYTDEELDLLEKTDFGEKTKLAEESEETDGDETEESEDEPKEKKGPKVDPEIEEAMKEVGAKDPKELAEKIKDLRKALSGKDAQAVAKLNKNVEELQKAQQSELALWNDFKKGVPEAVNIMRNRGLIPGEQNQNVEQKQNGTFIDKDKFIDPESAEMVNSVIGSLKAEIDSLKNEFGTVKSERERYINESASTKARNSVIDEMVKVSQNYNEFKDVPNFRDALNTYLEKGESNPKLQAVFDELFDVADKSNTSLEDAYWIKKGRDAQKEIQQAKQAGIKEAYKPKPNPSLSDAQTGDEGSRIIVKPLSEQEIQAMEEPGGYKKMPESWFDKEGEPIKSRVPKNAWRLFW